MLFVYVFLIVGATPDITTQVREDALSEDTTSFFLIRNEEFNGSSTTLQLEQNITMSNGTVKIWKTNKTINSFSYAGTSSFNKSDLGVVCLTVRKEEEVLSEICYPEPQNKTSKSNETESTSETESESEEEAEDVCSPPSITLEKAVFTSQIRYVVRGDTYTYWVEDSAGDKVRSKRTSSTEGTKRYTPGGSGGYVVRAENECGEDEASAIIPGERRTPYLKIRSVDVRQDELLAHIELYKQSSSSYATHISVSQDEQEKKKKTLYVRGDNRDIELRIPFSTEYLSRGPATVKVEGFDREDSLSVYVDKEEEQIMGITSLYTRKQLFEPFDLHVHLSDSAQGYLRVTYEDKQVKNRITGVKEEIRVDPSRPETVFMVEIEDPEGEVQDMEALHVELEKQEDDKQKEVENDEEVGLETARNITPPHAPTSNKTSIDEDQEERFGWRSTESVLLASTVVFLSLYGVTRLRT